MDYKTFRCLIFLKAYNNHVQHAVSMIGYMYSTDLARNIKEDDKTREDTKKTRTNERTQTNAASQNLNLKKRFPNASR